MTTKDARELKTGDFVQHRLLGTYGYVAAIGTNELFIQWKDRTANWVAIEDMHRLRKVTKEAAHGEVSR